MSNKHYPIKCRSNRGGMYLIPVTSSRITPTPDDPVTGYTIEGKEVSGIHPDAVPYLTKREHLVRLKSGQPRITRTAMLWKSVRPGRNGFTFVQVTIPESQIPWETLCKRTNDPKLAWLERQLDAASIPHKRAGRSWHAPILTVPRQHLDAAWAILGPVDDIPDDDRRFM